MATLNFPPAGPVELILSQDERDVAEEQTEALDAYVTMWLKERQQATMLAKLNRLSPVDKADVLSKLRSV